MYITIDEYTALYDPVGHIREAGSFDRLCFEACRHIDRLTTGIDGFKKLKRAFPVDEDDAKAVKHCAAAVIHFLEQIRQVEHLAESARGYTQTENGMQGKVVSSVAAGNESVSYTSHTGQTLADVAALEPAARDAKICSLIHEHLSGIADANGVYLLYMGPYPA